MLVSYKGTVSNTARMGKQTGCHREVNDQEHETVRKTKVAQHRVRSISFLFSRTLKRQSETESKNNTPSSYKPGVYIVCGCLLPPQVHMYRYKQMENLPCFWMTCKNLMMTLEEGLMMTCLLPVFSALLIAFKASAKTDVLVIFLCYSASQKSVSNIKTHRHITHRWKQHECPP